MHASQDQLELIDALRRQVAELRSANAVLAQEVAALRREADDLRDRGELAREVMDNIATFVGLLGTDGRVELINRRILEYAGKTVEELEQWGMSDLVHVDDLERAIEANGRGRASEAPFAIVYRMRRHDGVYRWFEGHHEPLKDRDGRVVRWCVSVTDIDERKRAEDTLRKSEQEARLIVNSIPGLIAVLTADGALEMVNDQLYEYFGKTFDGQSMWWSKDVIHPEHLARTVHAFADAMASGNPIELEIRARRSDGVYRWLHSRALPLRDESGRMLEIRV